VYKTKLPGYTNMSSHSLKLSNILHLDICLMGIWITSRAFRHEAICTHTFSFSLMNKGIISARSDMESGNHSPHKKINRSRQGARLYTFLKVSSDANPWPTPIWDILLVLAVSPNVVTKYRSRPAVRLKWFKVRQSFKSMRAAVIQSLRTLWSPQLMPSAWSHTYRRLNSWCVPGEISLP
jgi:hypothetical protein